MTACCPCNENECIKCGSNNVTSMACTCGRDHYAHLFCLNCDHWWSEQSTCFLCDSTGLRMDIPGQIVRIEDPTYTCNGCQGTGRIKMHPIGEFFYGSES